MAKWVVLLVVVLATVMAVSFFAGPVLFAPVPARPTLYGYVTSTSGPVLSGATVTVTTAAGTVVSSQTDSNGWYLVSIPLSDWVDNPRVLARYSKAAYYDYNTYIFVDSTGTLFSTSLTPTSQPQPPYKVFLKGFVLDTNQRGIGGATVRAIGGSTNISATADLVGRYVLSLPANVSYTVTASRPHWNSQTRTVSIYAVDVTLDFTLTWVPYTCDETNTCPKDQTNETAPAVPLTSSNMAILLGTLAVGGVIVLAGVATRRTLLIVIGIAILGLVGALFFLMKVI